MAAKTTNITQKTLLHEELKGSFEIFFSFMRFCIEGSLRIGMVQILCVTIFKKVDIKF